VKLALRELVRRPGRFAVAGVILTLIAILLMFLGGLLDGLIASRGLGVIFISHNPHHAYPVGDRFVILNRGKLLGDWKKGEISRDELVKQMSGGAELDALEHELGRPLDQPAAS
jgi:ABC-type branched-subunit amino acid transport system ATPase component